MRSIISYPEFSLLFSIALGIEIEAAEAEPGK
jgi:hypothetical protein